MGWLNSANTGSGAVASYQQVSVPHTNNVVPGYSSASVAGQQQIAAQGATVDINDAVLSNNLQMLGTIRANQASRQTDISNLETATQSQDASQQTIMATLQRINQALLLQLRTQQDAKPDQRQSCLATDRRPEAAARRDEIGVPRFLRIRELLQRQYHHDQQWGSEPAHADLLIKRRTRNRGIEYGYGTLRLYRPGLPVARSDSGTFDNRDGHAHRSGAGDDHAGLVRRAGIPCLRAWRSWVQHGEVPEPLHAAYLRLCDGELLRQFHPGLAFRSRV